MTSFVLGIDVGTSYTAAAIGRRRAEALSKSTARTRFAQGGGADRRVPRRDGGVVVGEAAERRVIEHPDQV